MNILTENVTRKGLVTGIILTSLALGIYHGLKYQFFEPKYSAMCRTGPQGALTHDKVVRYNLDDGAIQLYFEGDVILPRMIILNGFCVITKNSNTTTVVQPPPPPKIELPRIVPPVLQRKS